MTEREKFLEVGFDPVMLGYSSLIKNPEIKDRVIRLLLIDGYQLLEPGESIRGDDEFFSASNQAWALSMYSTRKIVEEYNTLHRRKIVGSTPA